MMQDAASADDYSEKTKTTDVGFISRNTVLC